MPNPQPRTVGSRELKTRLGTYLRQVKAGATLIVTERGRPVAELRPVAESAVDLDSRLRDLVATGVLSGEVAERRPLEYFEPIRGQGASLSGAVLEDREDRI